MSLYTLTPAIYDNISQFLPVKFDYSFESHGMLAKKDMHMDRRSLIALSSCDKRLRRLLFDLVFRQLWFGQRGKDRDRGYKAKMEWLLESGSQILASVEFVCVLDFLPNAFEVANVCLARMHSLRRYVHASMIGVARIFIPTLLALPNLLSIEFAGGFLDSAPALVRLSHKLDTYDICIWLHNIVPEDCLAFAPTNPEIREGAKEAVLAAYRKAVPDVLAKVLAATRETARSLSLSVPGDQCDVLERDWFERSLSQAKVLANKTRFSMPFLRRLTIAYASFTPALLKELLAGSPYLTHLDLSFLHKPELETKMPALPLLKRLNTFALECPGRFPVFYSSLLNGATLEYAIFNGITPLDLGDLITSPGFNSAESLRTLDIRLENKWPFHAYHLEKMVRHCVNLDYFSFSYGKYEAELPEIFAVLAQLPKLREVETDHSWDTSAEGVLPAMIHDGKSIRSRKTGNFRILACPGNSMNEEIHRRIREDIDGCRPLYVKRFRAIARAHPSLQTIIWKPTPEVVWTWKFSRDGAKIKMKDNAVIKFDGGSNFDVKYTGVLMTNL